MAQEHETLEHRGIDYILYKVEIAVGDEDWYAIGEDGMSGLRARGDTREEAIEDIEKQIDEELWRRNHNRRTTS